MAAAIGANAQWTKNTPPSFYNTWVKKTSEIIRTITNTTGATMTDSSSAIKIVGAWKVTGSSGAGSDPHWTLPFNTLFDNGSNGYETIPAGTLVAHSTKIFWWKWDQDEGIEKWTEDGTSNTKQRDLILHANFTIDSTVFTDID